MANPGDAFWSGRISNPLEVTELITYLLLIRRLDDIQTLAERKARVTGTELENPVFLPGQHCLRWSEFKDTSPEVMQCAVADEVFPFLRSLGDSSTYSEHMKDARYTIPTPALLSKVVDMLDGIPMADREMRRRPRDPPERPEPACVGWVREVPVARAAW